MTLRMAWSCMWCSSNFTPFNTFLKQVLISVFLLACYKSFWVSLYYLNIDVWTHLNLAWSRFIVLFSLFCCGGFIYNTRVERLVSCLVLLTSIKRSFSFLFLLFYKYRFLQYLFMFLVTCSMELMRYLAWQFYLPAWKL